MELSICNSILPGMSLEVMDWKMRQLKQQCAIKHPFWNGFVCGLAAPMLIFSTQPLEVSRAPNRELGSYWRAMAAQTRSSIREVERERRRTASLQQRYG
jgi:hypothetical protein